MSDNKTGNAAKFLPGLAGLLFVIVAVFAGWNVFSNGAGFIFSSSASSMVFKGFQPGTALSYSLYQTQSAAKPVKGDDIVGASGEVQVQGLPADRYDALAYTYDLTIREQDQKSALNLTLTLDKKSNRVSVLGEGLNRFEPVRIQAAGQSFQAYADWAGLLTQQIPFDNGASADEGAELQIALLGNYLPDDMRQSNPKIIQVLLAPGGGGPTPSQVNTYSAEGTCTSIVPYSWCNPGWMQEHIDSLKETYVEAFREMTTEFSVVMMLQAKIFGTFLDAENQLDVQREFQVLRAEANKDYQPSEQMCQFGTFVRSIAKTEQKVAYEKRAINSILMAAYTGQEHSSTAEGYSTDIQSRVAQFRQSFCDMQDNNAQLAGLCDHDQNAGGGAGATDEKRISKDIDYAKTLWGPLTVNVSFRDAPNPGSDEADILALARNLYWPQALEPGLAQDLPGQALDYSNARRLFAVGNVAHNTFSNIVAMKAQSESGIGAQSGWNYMKSLLRNFGLPDSDIHGLMGAYPSYYAQMEVLTKKIYQGPDFYTNLYDKPANVKRIGASMDAIKLMQGRDMLEAALRREMLTSMLVEDALKTEEKALNGRIAAESRKTR